MYDWTVLNQAVGAALASGRVGAPLFVRWTASAAQSKDDLKPLLVEMSLFTGLWLDASPRQLYATGVESHGHLSLALKYDNGGSALLALTLAHGRPFMDLAIYGAKGAIYHTDSAALARSGTADPRTGDSDERRSQQSADLSLVEYPDWYEFLSTLDPLTAVERSLESNQPVLLSDQGGQP